MKFIANLLEMYMRKLFRKLLRLVPDRLYTQWQYFHHFHRFADLKNPQTFNEKLQWLKLHDHNPLYTTLVDKYAVKKWVADKIGEQHIIPTLGVWKKAEDISFDKLPNQFVLKVNHDSGGLVICRDKSKLDKQAAIAKLSRALENNGYWYGREWPYKNVKPCILAEKYMEDAQQPTIIDYKFYTFNGEPRFIAVCQGMSNHATARMSYMDMSWAFMPFTRTNYRPFQDIPHKPAHLQKMYELAKILAAGTTFIRVDFYEVENQVYFGELTFLPSSGLTPFSPKIWDREIGSWLTLPRGK